MERVFDTYQQEVIGISGGRHLVLAPPGCGKTDILTERIIEAHRQGVEYADMLCLTFTNRAAKGMAGRIADRTGNPVPDDLFVGNIHRFCSQLLFNEGLVGPDTAIIDEGDVESIVQEELCKRMGVAMGTSALMRLQHALWQLALGMNAEVVLHAEQLGVGGIDKMCDILRRPHTHSDLGDIYLNIEAHFAQHPSLEAVQAAQSIRLARAYQRYKEEYNLLDYDDLLVLVYHHLLHHEHRTYSWIEIDEVQDLNPLQLAIVDAVAAEQSTIVYLGDEQQAIFSFIGAKLETLEGLKEQCKGHLHYLRHNYRSPAYLLDLQNDFALRVLGIRPELLPTTANSVPHEPADLCLLDVGDAGLEAYYTARFARRYGDLDPNGRVAILVSTNREADELSEVMTNMHISHFRISGTDLFSTPTVKLLASHAAVLCDEMVFIAWARLLWGLGVTATYSQARDLMRDMRRVALLPTDLLLYPDSSYLQRMTEAYNSEELVIFDTETTGLDTATDDIVQIAAIRVRGGKQVGHPFNIILETDKELPPTVGGHPNPMIEVYNASRRYPRAEGLRMFMDYCAGRTLVGHNVNYDYQILKHNLVRSCPDLVLEELCPYYFDTLKQARLVRPRLRNYKLGHLLEVFHLEGQNSHQADDDIMATKSLLDFCHRASLTMLADQRRFLDLHRTQTAKFVECYAPLYLHAQQQLDSNHYGLVEELEYTYRAIVQRQPSMEVEKWQHLTAFLSSDLIRTDLYPTLRLQLQRYSTDLGTCREADLCGGSLGERFIISTVHKAKGLEFETVIVYRGLDGVYPQTRSWAERQIQEDARKLFVALSRSRQRLCITSDRYLGNTPHNLSPFLEKVKHHFALFRRGYDGKIRLS